MFLFIYTVKKYLASSNKMQIKLNLTFVLIVLLKKTARCQKICHINFLIQNYYFIVLYRGKNLFFQLVNVGGRLFVSGGKILMMHILLESRCCWIVLLSWSVHWTALQEFVTMLFFLVSSRLNLCWKINCCISLLVLD